MGKSKTKEVYEDTVLYQEDVFRNTFDVKQEDRKYLNSLLREFEKSRDDSKMLERVAPEFRPIVSRAMYAMLAGGLSDALLKVDVATKEAEQKKTARINAQKAKMQTNVNIADSFFVR